MQKMPLLLVLIISANGMASDFDSLAKRIPSNANTVLAIDIDRALATQMAKSNGWGDATARGSLTYLPPEADKVIVGAHVDPPRQFARTWEVAMMGLKESLPMRLVARAEGGYTDEINGRPAAWVPSDAYFVSVDEKTMGLMYPANRQAVSRWVTNVTSGRNQGLSDYLLAAVSRVKQGPQIVLALDTTDVAQAHRVQQKLLESEYVTSQKLNVDELVPLFTGMKGVVLNITITDKAKVDAQINFDKPVGFNKQVAKTFVMSAMTNFQAEIPGMEKWQFFVNGSTISATGELDESGLRRLLSFQEIPSTKFSSLKEADTESAPQAGMAKSSLAYFQSINKLIDDLRKASKSSRGDNYWFDRYAQKIDRLPILHVDPDLLDFGQKTAQTLRVMSGSRKSANIQGGVAQSNIAASGGSYGNYDYSYGNYGYYRGGGGVAGAARSNLTGSVAAANAAKNRASAGATNTKIQGFKLIDDARADIRRVMTERYNVEF